MMMQRPVQPATRRVQHPAAGRCGLDREAGPGPSYGDLLDDGTRAGLANDFTNRNTTFCLGTNAFAPQHLMHPTELVFLGLLSLSHTDACGLRVMSCATVRVGAVVHVVHGVHWAGGRGRGW